jgi:type II secretory pathway component PulF
MASIRPIQLRNVKKSQGFEAWFFVIVVLLAFALFFAILNNTWKDIKQPLDEGLSQAMPNDSPVNISRTLGQVTSAGLQFDKLIPMILIGLFGFLLISAGAIIRHPIMIFVGIIILAVVILIAVVFSNVYNNITESDAFADTKADLPIQDLFMQYLPVIVVLMAVVIIGAVLWSRSSGGAGGL